MNGIEASSAHLNLSVVLITKNAERTLDLCLASLPPHCEIIVVDCGSTDRTVAIAAKYNAHIVNKPFTNFAEQKNAALALANRAYILSLDADEELDEELRRSLVQLVTTAQDDQRLYAIRRRLVFMDKVMRYGRTTDYPVRVCHRGAAQFIGTIHEELKATNPQALPTQTLAGTMLHHSYANLAQYFEKFNSYTTLIANERLSRGVTPPGIVALALRPFLNFLYRYLWCGGCLDGFPGYCWALLGSFYSFAKYAKYRELCALKKLEHNNGR